MAQFSLSWDAYKQNICSGLSALQQNGEFVDMTLAADGHHVKVHQMVMSLVSPYLKELITSTQCSHPVIFLNKVSYPTLSAILEYIYTGEVLVAKDNLTELVDAARELHIKGLQDMKLELSTPELVSQALSARSKGLPLSDLEYFKPDTQTQTDKPANRSTTRSKKDTTETQEILYQDDGDDHQTFEDAMDTDPDDTVLLDNTTTETTPAKHNDTHIQYTLSNQGALQMILNRCVYYLRYTSRKGPSGHRQWRCIDYVRAGVKCPATVITKDDVVIKRFSAHNHPFHDKQILRKVHNQSVYSAIHEAEALGQNMKMGRLTKPDVRDKKETDTE